MRRSILGSLAAFCGLAALGGLAVSAAEASPGPTPLDAVSPPSSRTPPPVPCAARKDYAGLDFWIGEWEVRSSPGQPDAGEPAGRSVVEKLAGGCLVLESYTAGPYAGKSINFFDVVLGRWRQTWMGAEGAASEFSGTAGDGVMNFEGESHLPDGRTVRRKMILTRLGPDRVRQHSELSRDGGKTWVVNYDYTYKRVGRRRGGSE